MGNKQQTDKEGLANFINEQLNGDYTRFLKATSELLRKKSGRPAKDRCLDSLFYITVLSMTAFSHPKIQLNLLKLQAEFNFFLNNPSLKKLPLRQLSKLKLSDKESEHLKKKIAEIKVPANSKKLTIAQAITQVIDKNLFPALITRFQQPTMRGLASEAILEEQLLTLYKKMQQECKRDPDWLNNTPSELYELIEEQSKKI